MWKKPWIFSALIGAMCFAGVSAAQSGQTMKVMIRCVLASQGEVVVLNSSGEPTAKKLDDAKLAGKPAVYDFDSGTLALPPGKPSIWISEEGILFETERTVEIARAGSAPTGGASAGSAASDPCNG